jgi:flagellar M-ring protein FliF
VPGARRTSRRRPPHWWRRGAPLQVGTGGSGGSSAAQRHRVTRSQDRSRDPQCQRRVKRLAAAVVVNHRAVPPTARPQRPLSGDGVDKLTALVRKASAQERGDSVKLINAPFKIEPAAADVPLCSGG